MCTREPVKNFLEIVHRSRPAITAGHCFSTNPRRSSNGANRYGLRGAARNWIWIQLQHTGWARACGGLGGLRDCGRRIASVRRAPRR
jgi:hypothetical protein